MLSALSVEQGGVAALLGGLPEDVSHDSDVRRPGAGVSRSAGEHARHHHEAQLARLLQQARVPPQYAELLAELGVQDAADLSTASARELAPMPLFHAKRLIRRAAEIEAAEPDAERGATPAQTDDAERAAALPDSGRSD